MIEKAKKTMEFTMLCNKVCFNNYSAEMTHQEA